MIECDDRFKFIIGNLPTWFLIELDKAQIPHRFHFDELSPEQKQVIAMLTEIYFLFVDGDIKIQIDQETQLPEYKVRDTEKWIK